ncbi:hypothetical protein H5410_060849, partial [Solanum commersonii]
ECLKAYIYSGKRPCHQYNSDNIPLQGGYQLNGGRGTYGRQSLGHTSRGDHFGPTCVRSHVMLVASLQHVTFGDNFYECGEVGQYVRDCRRAQI